MTSKVTVKEKGPVSTGGLIALIIPFVIVWGLGLKGIIDFAPYISSGEWTTVFGSFGAIMPYLLFSAVFLILLSIIGGILVLKLGKDHGIGVVYAGNTLLLIISLVSAALPFIFLGDASLETKLYSAIAPLFMLLISVLNFTIWRDRLRRSGKFLSLTCSALLDEKETLVVPLISPFLYMITLGFLALGVADVIVTIPAYLTANAEYYIFGMVTVDVVAFLYLTILFYYMSDAIIISIVYDWYRNRDPSFKTGVRHMLNVLGALAVFAIYSTIVKLIQSALESRGQRAGASAVFYRSASDIVGRVWKYINYFTLPAIVIDRKGTHHAIKRSVKLLFRYYADVIIRESAVKWGMIILYLMFALPFFIAGMGVGYIVFGFDVLMMVAVGVVFLLVGSIFAYPIFHALTVGYITIMYGFVEDIESNFAQPSRIKGEIFYELKPAIQKAYEKARVKDPNAPPPPEF